MIPSFSYKIHWHCPFKLANNKDLQALKQLNKKKYEKMSFQCDEGFLKYSNMLKRELCFTVSS